MSGDLLAHPPEELAEAQTDLYDHAKTLRDAQRLGRFPRNTDSCRSLYGACSCLDVCTGMARLDDDALFCDREER
jgi:hypothetical protein